jgi:hypothetical protein
MNNGTPAGVEHGGPPGTEYTLQGERSYIDSLLRNMCRLADT